MDDEGTIEEDEGGSEGVSEEGVGDDEAKEDEGGSTVVVVVVDATDEDASKEVKEPDEGV